MSSINFLNTFILKSSNNINKNKHVSTNIIILVTIIISKLQ
jgi:hypothetical protein